MTAPIALSCGEPAGIGPELAVRAWDVLRDECPFIWIGDPAHLPPGAPIVEMTNPADAVNACAQAMPVLPLRFEGSVSPGVADPRNATGVITAITRSGWGNSAR